MTNETLGKANNLLISKKAALVSMIMILIVGVISNYIYALAVYVGPLHDTLGWSKNSIVVAYSAAMFCEIPAYLIGGWLSARFGMKKILVFSGGIYGLAIMGSGMVKSVILFIILQGIIATLAMYGVFIATLALINVLYPKKKGTVMGLLYGTQAFGGAAMAPMANWFIEQYSVGLALILQGIIFAIVMVICSLFVTDPTRGNAKLMKKLQDEAEAKELEEQLAAKEAKPSMRWKKVLLHPSFWFLFMSIIMIQMIGNCLVTDISDLAQSNYGATAAKAAWVATAFAIGAGVGGMVIGVISDKVGPYRTTFWLGIIDGILLILLAVFGAHSFTVYAVMCIIQGFTYNGMTTLNPIMLTDSYHADDIGITMGAMAIAYAIVGILGPQIGLSMPFIPMIIICATLSIIGGLLSQLSAKSVNKYYQTIGSKCVVK